MLVSHLGVFEERIGEKAKMSCLSYGETGFAHVLGQLAEPISSVVEEYLIVQVEAAGTRRNLDVRYSATL